MLLLGYTGSIVSLQLASTIIIIPGVVLMLSGAKHLKALSFPLLYLIFMIPPILDILLSKLHWPFQLFAASVAATVLRLFHIPVYRQCQYLMLPNTTLEVANGCSGVRYLVAIIASGIPVAYFTQKTCFSRTIFLLLTLVIGILVNPLHVVLVSLWSCFTGWDTHGTGHIFQAFFIVVVGYLFLFFAAWVFSSIPLESRAVTIGKQEYEIILRNLLLSREQIKNSKAL